MNYLEELQKLEDKKQELVEEAMRDKTIAFEVWSRYADKEDYDFVNDVDGDSLIYILLNAYAERYETYFWYDIIELLSEEEDYYEENIKQLKQELIDYNLNSICMDW